MFFLIGADIVPTESNFDYFSKSGINNIVSEELYNILYNADFRIFNLEVPLCDNITPILKNGPTLSAPISSVKGLKELKVDLVTIGNNHIMDQGVQGIKSTISSLKDAGIDYVGGGENVSEASRPYIFNFGFHTVGVYACSEHEFSIATIDSAGANPYDPTNVFDHIRKLKELVDYVVILYHGGKEHYRYPSPELQKNCRKMCDEGADLVVCQHSHCIGCEENFNNSKIVYGQGNFLFDRSNDECWLTGLLIKINEEFQVSYLPIIKCNNGVALADVEKSREILDAFYTRSQSVENDDMILEEYNKLSDLMIDYYLDILKGKDKLIHKVMIKVFGKKYERRFLANRYSQKQLVKLYNVIMCEAHRELLLKGIERKMGFDSQEDSRMK